MFFVVGALGVEPSIPRMVTDLQSVAVANAAQHPKPDAYSRAGISMVAEEGLEPSDPSL